MEPTNDNEKINVIIRVRPTLRSEDPADFVDIMDVILFLFFIQKTNL
jgi:hypothetical protein